MPQSEKTAPPVRRAVGVRAGLTVDRIVEVARSLAPDALTVQAVADALGVDRKAVSHHVSDRNTLLALVARDSFRAQFAEVHIGSNDSWQQACRTFARGFVASTLSIGGLVEHIRLGDPYVTDVLEPTEAVLAKMVAAGFDDEAAMRSVSLLTNICLTYARDRVLARDSGVSPRSVILRTALKHRDPSDYPTLARIAEGSVTTYDDAQLEFALDVFIAGAETAARAFDALD